MVLGSLIVLCLCGVRRAMGSKQGSYEPTAVADTLQVMWGYELNFL